MVLRCIISFVIESSGKVWHKKQSNQKNGKNIEKRGNVMEAKESVKKILSEETIEDLSCFLSENPTAGVIIKNSGSLRKVRWSIDNNKVKSVGCRIIYYFQIENKPLYLIYGYAKNVQEDLTSEQL